MERYLTVLNITEIVIKPTIRYRSHLLGWLSSENQKIGVAEDVEKGQPCSLLVGMHNRAAIIENNTEVPTKKLKIEPTR